MGLFDTISSVIGTAGGAGGTGFQKPGHAPLQQTSSTQDVQSGRKRTNGALDALQRLLAAIEAQDGLNAQSQVMDKQRNLADMLAQNGGAINQALVFNQMNNLSTALENTSGLKATEQALYGQGGLNAQLAAANGIANQSSAVQGLQGIAGQQAATAATLEGLANGTGPNPAQAAYNQSIGDRVAHTGALLASQRGASANVGATSKRIAREGARQMQADAAQNAELQSKQQREAINALGAHHQSQALTQSTIGNIGSQQVAAQQLGLSTEALQGSNLVGLQQQGLGQLGQQANTQVNSELLARNAEAGQANTIGNQQILGTNLVAGNSLQNSAQEQQALAGLNNAAVTNQDNVNAANANLAGARMGQQGAVLGGIANAAGGVASLAGNFLSPAASKKAEGGEIEKPSTGPQSKFGQFYAQFEAGGFKMDGGPIQASNPAQRAVSKGDSYANDKVPIMASAGEFMLPRTVMQAKDPAKAAGAFVKAYLAKKGKRA